MEPTTSSTAPGTQTWEISTITVGRWLAPLIAWIALGWLGGLAFADVRKCPCAALIALFFAWAALGIVAAIQTVRLFFRSKGVLRLLSIAVAIPAAFLAQQLLFQLAWAPPTDATMLADFVSRRAALEVQAPSGGPLRIVTWTWPAPLVTADSMSKGFLRTDFPPTPVVESLDRAWWSIPRAIPAYRRIEGNWYVFLEDR